MGEAAAVVLAGPLDGRLPRARPEPRVEPNEGAGAGTLVGWLVAVASAEAPDDSVEDMSMLLVESACQCGGADDLQPEGGDRSRTVAIGKLPSCNTWIRATAKILSLAGLASLRAPPHAPRPWTNSRRSFKCRMRSTGVSE